MELYENSTNLVPSAQKFASAAVATDSSECSKVGATLLEQGGNAVDAAIAAALCLGVVSPFASGIGGGGFMLIHNSTTNKQDLIDFLETAPIASTFDMYYQNQNASRSGGLAIGVPGEIAGFYQAWKLYGSLPWKTLFTPSIALAKNMKCSKLLNIRLNSLGSKTPTSFKKYFWINGSPCNEGDVIKRPELANTLELISIAGPTVLYSGSLTKGIIDEIRQAGGIMTEQDLREYTPVHRTPIQSYYHGKKVMTAPAPASGSILLMGMNMMETFPLSKLGSSSSTSYHYLIEAMKHGFGHRSLIGDPNFIQNTTLLSKLHQKDVIQELLTKITNKKTYPSSYYLYNEEVSKLDGGTTHLSIVDANKNAVSLTSSVNHLFGSLVMSPSTGIIFNNQMDDFSTQPNQPNEFGLIPSRNNIIEPRKRPLSSMCPTLVFERNKLKHVVGGSGGAHIISSIYQVLIGLIDFGRDLKIQVDFGRFHTQLYPENVRFEQEFPGILVNELSALGHNISVTNSEFADGQTGVGAVQAVTIEEDVIYAVSDPRKFGIPAGY